MNCKFMLLKCLIRLHVFKKHVTRFLNQQFFTQILLQPLNLMSRVALFYPLAYFIPIVIKDNHILMLNA